MDTYQKTERPPVLPPFSTFEFIANAFGIDAVSMIEGVSGAHLRPDIDATRSRERGNGGVSGKHGKTRFLSAPFN